MNQKALIFGAGGFVGKYLADELRSHNYEIVLSDVKKPDSIPDDAEFYSVDLLNTDYIKQLIQMVKPTAIINLAAISSVGLSWKIPQTTIQVNVVGTLNILEAAKTVDPMPKVMFIGTSEEYEQIDKPINEETPLNANNPYGISKQTQEKFVDIYRDRYGMQIYYVRPFNHTGIGQRDTFVLPSFCKQVADIEKSGKAGSIKVGNLAAKRDFSDVRDIVHAYRMILESDDCKAVYNVGSGIAYSLSDLLNYIVGLSTQKITIKVDPERFRPIDTPLIQCDHSKITNELGWKPEHDIKDTLKEMYQFYLEQ